MVLALALPLSASADVQRYRFEIDRKSGEEAYAGELPSAGPVAGPWHEVERDPKGRIVRVASFRSAEKQSEVTYHYTGDAATYDSAENFRAGEHTGKEVYGRNADGDIVRTDHFTVEGSPTNNAVRSITPGGFDEVTRGADGTMKEHHSYIYADGGNLSSYRRIVGTTYYEYLVDATTGQLKSRKKVEDGKQVLSTTYAYDENGEKLREDIFDETGKPYATIAYSDGLLVRKSYTFDDGSRRESTTTYGAKRWATEAKFTVNGVLVCTFTYDRLPDGTVKRTLALGPKGDLWAEYPDRSVNEVTQNGQPVDRTDGIIHHAGNWW